MDNKKKSKKQTYATFIMDTVRDRSQKAPSGIIYRFYPHGHPPTKVWSLSDIDYFENPAHGLFYRVPNGWHPPNRKELNALSRKLGRAIVVDEWLDKFSPVRGGDASKISTNWFDEDGEPEPFEDEPDDEEDDEEEEISPEPTPILKKPAPKKRARRKTSGKKGKSKR